MSLAELSDAGGVLIDVDLTAEVSAYNEVDSRVMMEAVGYSTEQAYR